MTDNTNKTRPVKAFIFFITFGAILFAVPAADSAIVIQTEELLLGNEVKASGQKLMAQSGGFTRIHDDSSYELRTVVIGIHGTKSQGYEWVGPLKNLAREYKHTYFYRYNWDVCPDSSALQLSKDLIDITGQIPGVDRIVLFGHSSGGLVVTYLASLMHINIPVEIHTIASPLKGYARLNKRCELPKLRDGVLSFPQWEENVAHFQWRTQHMLDNAFNRLKQDPQDVNLYNSEVTLLPDTMNGRRLGHNWSITWVIDEHLRIPHKP